MGDANDPEVYTAAILAILSDYDEGVQQSVVDPRGGLPSQVQWLPTPKEVRDYCEIVEARLRREKERDAGIRAQLAERQQLEEFRLLNPPKETWAQTRADLERRGFQFSRKKRVEVTADELMAKHGVSREQWDAIPDLPKEKFEELEIQAAEKAGR